MRPSTAAVGLLFTLLALGPVLNALPRPDASRRWATLPAFSRGFVSRPLPLSATEHRVFGAAQVYRRLLVTPQGDFTLTVIDSTRNRHAIHDPLYCARGAGFTVAAETRITLSHGTGKWLTLQRRSERRVLTYWFSDGKTQHVSPTRAWFADTLRHLTIGGSGPATVLVLLEGSAPPPPALISVLQSL